MSNFFFGSIFLDNLSKPVVHIHIFTFTKSKSKSFFKIKFLQFDIFFIIIIISIYHTSE